RRLVVPRYTALNMMLRLTLRVNNGRLEYPGYDCPFLLVQMGFDCINPVLHWPNCPEKKATIAALYPPRVTRAVKWTASPAASMRHLEGWKQCGVPPVATPPHPRPEPGLNWIRVQHSQPRLREMRTLCNDLTSIKERVLP